VNAPDVWRNELAAAVDENADAATGVRQDERGSIEVAAARTLSRVLPWSRWIDRLSAGVTRPRMRFDANLVRGV
jgi:hypothetical protein